MKNEKQLIVVIEGPSGVGKDAIMKGLVEKYPESFEKVPSMTTRAMREGESQGNPYYFVSVNEFQRQLANDDIFEHTVRHDTYRGMSRVYFDRVLEKNKFPLKDCDKIGLYALRKVYGEKNVFGLFITCPKDVIEQRLIGRGETGDSLKQRLNNYDEYINEYVHYNVSIENIDLDKAIDNVYNAIKLYYESM